MLFFCNLISSELEKKSKRCEHDTKNSNAYGFEQHRHSIKGTKLLLKVIKAIITIVGWPFRSVVDYVALWNLDRHFGTVGIFFREGCFD